VPDNDTPVYITTILLTHVGIPVKSTEVPDVVGLAVPDVSILEAMELITAPVIVGLVNVLFVSV
jgi:hypothetical protein